MSQLHMEAWSEPKDLLSENTELVEVKELPSGFRFYTPKTFTIRGFTLGEVKIASKARGGLITSSAAELMKNVINGIPVLDLLPIDFKALILMASRYTDSNYNITISVKCPRCGNRVLKELSFFDFDFGEIPKELPKIERGEGEEPLCFHPLNLRHEIRIEEILRTQDSLDISEKLLPLDEDFLKTIFCIKPELVYDPVSKVIETYTWLQNLPGALFNPIEEARKEVCPDINPVEVECSGCRFQFYATPYIDLPSLVL